jgi:hypothetical protein
MMPAVEPCSGMIAVAGGHGGILLLDFVSAIRAEGKALLLWHQKTRQHAAWFQRNSGRVAGFQAVLQDTRRADGE